MRERERDEARALRASRAPDPAMGGERERRLECHRHHHHTSSLPIGTKSFEQV